MFNRYHVTLSFMGLLSLTVVFSTVQPAQADEVETINVSNLHSQGSGDLIAVVYMDLECVYCKRLHNTMKKVLESYDGELMLAYKHFPLTSIHSNAKRESLAAECAAEQDHFYPFINKLFRKTTFSNNLTDRKLVNFATALGIKSKKFRSCLKDKKYLKRVNNDIAEGERLHMIGTPTTFIVDSDGTVLEQINGAVSQDTIEGVLEQYID